MLSLIFRGIPHPRRKITMNIWCGRVLKLLRRKNSLLPTKWNVKFPHLKAQSIKNQGSSANWIGLMFPAKLKPSWNTHSLKLIPIMKETTRWKSTEQNARKNRHPYSTLPNKCKKYWKLITDPTNYSYPQEEKFQIDLPTTYWSPSVSHIKLWIVRSMNQRTISTSCNSLTLKSSTSIRNLDSSSQNSSIFNPKIFIKVTKNDLSAIRTKIRN